MRTTAPTPTLIPMIAPVDRSPVSDFFPASAEELALDEADGVAVKTFVMTLTDPPSSVIVMTLLVQYKRWQKRSGVLTERSTGIRWTRTTMR